MILYSLFVCIVLSLIRRDGLKAQLKYGLILFLIMVGGSLLFGWMMFLFI
jgi:hypothetical protein